MRLRLVILTLFLTPLLVGQQQHPLRFEDCDKQAKTQAELTECGSGDYKMAHDELQIAYQQLLRKAAGDKVAVQKIRAAQRAWIAFRDAQLAALYPAEDKQKEYGTVLPMCANLALADLTRQRTKMLKQMLNPAEGDVCGGGLSYPEGNETASPTRHKQ